VVNHDKVVTMLYFFLKKKKKAKLIVDMFYLFLFHT
jgi:hypothetical protein